LKKGLAILLTFSIIAQGMVNLGMCAYYQINKQMIADKLCINKDKPEMHCNGKCFLSKQLKKAEENEKRQSQSLNQKDEVMTVDTHLSTIFFIPTYSFLSFLGTYSAFRPVSPHTAIEQPPQVLA
jgi:hypothetical protein